MLLILIFLGCVLLDGLAVELIADYRVIISDYILRRQSGDICIPMFLASASSLRTNAAHCMNFEFKSLDVYSILSDVVLHFANICLCKKGIPASLR